MERDIRECLRFRRRTCSAAILARLGGICLACLIDFLHGEEWEWGERGNVRLPYFEGDRPFLLDGGR